MTIPPVSTFAVAPALPALPPAAPALGDGATTGPSFGELLNQALTRVNTEQVEARDALSALASGEQVDLHGTMIALEEAEIALRAMTSVRDRLVGVYEQVMNMAI